MNKARLLVLGIVVAATGHRNVLPAQTLAFEVASARSYEFARESPIHTSGNRVTVRGLLAGLVMTAYKLRTFQVTGALYGATRRAALRFTSLRPKPQVIPRRPLVVGLNGAKIKPSAPEVETKTVAINRVRTKYSNVSISELGLRLGMQFKRPLFDETALAEVYDFTLEYLPSPLGTASFAAGAGSRYG